MNRRLYLGIDTSNYKTSVAVTDDAGGLILEKSELLEVKEGSRGLRQSEAFYQHSMRLPEYIYEVMGAIDPSNIAAIGYSSRPRRVEGSYMPCFNAGINTAKTLSYSLKIPAYPFSHQEGHAAAIMPPDEEQRCIFMHLSGGTTEFLLCEKDSMGYNMQIAGGTRDISIGQLLDRFGVALGYPFPAGRYLDDMASAALDTYDLKKSSEVIPVIKVKDASFNLSGAETRLMRFASSDNKDEELVSKVCAELFLAISRILISSAEQLKDKYDTKKVYMAGGVASSTAVRNIIENAGIKGIHFGDPVHSGDNALGIARLACRIHKQ